jgi:hypothetical protein
VPCRSTGDCRIIDIADLVRHQAQCVDIDGVLLGVDPRFVDVEAVQARRSCIIVGDVPADRRGRHDDRVARLAARHERVQVAERTRTDAHLGEVGTEDLTGELRCDDFDLLDRLETHLVLIPRVPE